jgi:hypothetical protein
MRTIKYSSKCWISISSMEKLNSIKRHEFFSEFDVTQEVSKNADSLSIPYEFDNVRYNVVLYELYCKDDKNSENSRYFLVAKEIVSENELNMLIPYCRCIYHTSTPIFSCGPCKCCVGCVESMFYSQYVVKESRKHYNECMQKGIVLKRYESYDEIILSFMYDNRYVIMAVICAIVCTKVFFQ